MRNLDERDDINKYREKRRRRNKTIKFIVFVLVTTALIIVVINWKQILAPFKDIGSKADEGGFPVNLTGSANYVMGELGENFYLLTDTYLYTYNADGAELANKQHGFQNPVCSSNDKRALVYDKNGKELKMYSKNAEIFSKTFEDSIVFAKMGTEERSAVVTTSSRYSNFLYVLNSEGKQIFRWASPDEKIMQVCFGNDDKSVYVSVVGEKGGALVSSVLRFEVDSDQSELWRASIGDSVSYSLENCSDGIYAVTSAGSFLLNDQTGEITASNAYSKEISGIAETNGIRVMFFRDPVSNGETVNVFNDALEIKSSASVESLTAFDTNGGRLYILSGRSMTSYDSDLREIKTYELDDEYSDMEIIGNYAYLLGYNTVCRQEL